MSTSKKSRSRAYPILDLESGYKTLVILAQKLPHLGTTPVSREELAQKLGYSSGTGGVAARKIAGLTHYDLLCHRGTGSYSLGRHGLRLLQGSEFQPEFLESLRSALRQPSLFQKILEKYLPSGSLPSDLDCVLARHFGITPTASKDAADVFIRSAIFAGVLDEDGISFKTLRPPALPKGSSDSSIEPDVAIGGDASKWWKVEIRLPQLRSAWLLLPKDFGRIDLPELKVRLSFEIDPERLLPYLGLTSEPTPLRRSNLRPVPKKQAEASEGGDLEG